jgi:hypothetical protein
MNGGREKAMKKMIAVIALAIAVILTAPLAEVQAAKMRRIGILVTRTKPNANDKAFMQGLRDLGWV